jgi:hypothetical protein
MPKDVPQGKGLDDVFGKVEGLSGTEVTLQELLEKKKNEEEGGSERSEFVIPSFLEE